MKKGNMEKLIYKIIDNKNSNVKKLINKVAIITGAAGSFGKITAKLFLEYGAKLMLVDLTKKELKMTIKVMKANT
jgi:NADP-dependent 3-hydroxy acid dehydrogenase YdfG